MLVLLLCFGKIDTCFMKCTPLSLLFCIFLQMGRQIGIQVL